MELTKDLKNIKSSENLARFMHYAYEDISKMFGWETNKECRVRFEELPDKNRKVMLRLATLVLTHLKQNTRKIILKEYDDSLGYDDAVTFYEL